MMQVEGREEMRLCWPQCTAGRALTRSATGSLRRLFKKSVYLTVLAEDLTFFVLGKNVL